MPSGLGTLRTFDSLIDRCLCVAGALVFSQGPEFMQQYLQRLGGHLAEARRHMETFRQTAAQSGLTLDQFITQTAANTDTAVAKLSGVMTQSIDRVTALQSAHDALMQASLWERPFVFLRHLDMEIARATAAIFQPAVPTTAEGLVYSFAGMLTLLAVYHLGVKNLIRLLPIRRPTQAEAPAA